MIRVSEQQNWTVDYDTERGMYRVSYFQDNHCVDECWFDAYEEKEVKNNKVEVKKIKIHSGNDCWGKYEYDDVYVVTNKDGKEIYRSETDPIELINELIKVKEDTNGL